MSAHEHSYDVFISYSRRDRDFAARLEARLERFRPPRGLGFPGRPLRVFRDEGDLTGTDYFRSIEDHLNRSSSLIVICSPAARASDYVGDEIARFSQNKPADRIIPILVSGVPNNESLSEHEKAFPEPLCKVLEMPLATNYLGFDLKRDRIDRGSFQNAWYTVLANILQVSRSQVEERDRRRAHRRRNTTVAITSAVILSLSGLTAYSLIQRELAHDRYQQALARQLVIQSEATLTRRADQLPLSVLLAAEAARRVPSMETTQALRAGLTLLPRLDWKAPHPGPTGIDLRFTPDGRRVATADGIWDVVNGEPIAPLEHKGRSTAFAMSPDGRHIARGSGAGLAGVWDTETGRAILPQPLQHRGVVRTLVFHPKRPLLLTAGEDPVVRVWDIQAGRRMQALEQGDPHLSGTIRAAVFSADGGILAVARRDRVHLWDTATWRPVEPELEHDTGAVIDVAMDPNGTFIATVTPSALHIWSRFGKEKDRLLIGGTGLGGRLAVSPDGKHIGLSGESSRVWRWAQWHSVVNLETGGVIGFSPDGSRVAVGGRDNTARVHDLATGREIGRMTHEGAVQALRFNRDGLRVATLSADGAVRMWAARAEPEVARIEGEWKGFSRGGDHLVTVAGGRVAWLWTRSSGRTMRLPKKDTARTPVLSADKERLAAAYGDRVSVWAPPETEPIANLAHRPAIDWEQVRHREEVERNRSYRVVGPEIDRMKVEGSVAIAALGPKGHHVLTTRVDEIARLWDVARAVVLAEIPYRQSLSARFSKNGARFATLSPGESIRLWEASSGRSVAELAPADGIGDLSLDPEGRYVAGLGSGGVVVWDSERPKPVQRMPEARGLLQSSDGRYFLTREKGKARLWGFGDPVEVTTIECDCSIGQMVFSGDSRHFAVSGDDGYIRVRPTAPVGSVWDVEYEGKVGALGFSPEGRRLVATGAVLSFTEWASHPGRPRVTGVNAGWAKIWDLDNVERTLTLNLDQPVESLVFSPDGQYVALGGLVVDLTTGGRITRVDGRVVAFSADLRYLVTRDGDYTKVWSWRPADLVATACQRLPVKGLTHDAWHRYLGDEPYRGTCNGVSSVSLR